MKYAFTVIFFFILNAIVAQPVGDIQTDTAKANQYLELALQTTNTAQQNIYFNKALKLYEVYPFSRSQVKILSDLSAAYYTSNPIMGRKYARQAIDLSKLHLKDTLIKELIGGYEIMLKENSLVNIEMAIDYGKLLLKIAEIPSITYFETCSKLAANYVYVPDSKSLEQLIIEQDRMIQSDTTQWNNYLSSSFRAKMQLAYINFNYEKAVYYGKQCLAHNDILPFFSNQEIGNIQVEVGLNQAYIGQIENAVENIKEGIKISKATGYALGTYYANLASVYSMRFDKVHQSIEYAHKALDLFYQEPIKSKPFIETMHHNLSILYYNIQDYEKALVYIQKVLEVNTAPSTYQTLANIFFALGRKSEALTAIQKALVGLSPNFSSDDIYDNPSRFEQFSDSYFALFTLISKSYFLVDKGLSEDILADTKAGLATANLAKDIWDKRVKNINGYEKSQLAQLKELERILNTILGAQYYLYEKGELKQEAIFQTIEERKSIFLLESLTLLPLPDSIAQHKEKLINTMREYEQKLYLTQDSIRFYEGKVFVASIRLEEFLEQIKTDYPKAATSFRQSKFSNLTAIQNTLDPKSVIVEYAIYGKSLTILLITKEGIIIKQTEVNQKIVNEKIALLNALLNNSTLIKFRERDQFIDASHYLYKTLVEPIVKELSDKSNLIIISERNLLKLPFEVLLESDSKKPFHELNFLIEDFSINYQYSATIYQQLKQKPPIQDRSFFGFAPIFENGQAIHETHRSSEFMVDSLFRGIENNSFVSLPNSKIEIETIAQTIKKNKGTVKTVFAEHANKTQLRKILATEPYQFVHIATHGIVNFETPKLSALVCYDTSKDIEKALFFANEIQMHSIKADLVILSSCESGVGKLVIGEGLIALNRSFIYSGANNIIFSLWKVNDELTAQLMIDFYKYYFQTNSYTEALRQSKLQMLQDPITANPRYWAAFVLIGQ